MEVEDKLLYSSARDDFSIFVEAIIGLKNEKFHDELDDILAKTIVSVVVTFVQSISAFH